jgi:hypothetical protein
VCGGTHKCSTGDGGLIVCGRRDGPVAGFRHLGPSKGDPQFHLYRADAGTDVPDRPRKARLKDWPALARQLAGGFSPAARDELAVRLRLPPGVFDALPSLGVEGATTPGRTFSFPECDAAGAVIGINRRFPDGSKKVLPGGKRGLTLVTGWRDRPGPVYLVEGPSDTLAATAAGLAAVGRPSNTGGVNHLGALLAGLDPVREIVVLGENDRKPDGSWPGRDGAARTAAALARALGRSVRWALPPEGAKDARDWLTARVAEGTGWDEAGRAFAAALVFPPAGPPLIEVTVREHEVNDEAAAALGDEPDLYQRGGALVRVLNEPAPGSGSIRRPTGPRIDPLPAATLRERLTRCASWVKVQHTESGERVVPVHPPDWCVPAVHARGDWPAVRRLEAVVEYPVLLPDGGVLLRPGFDTESGLLYAPPAELPLDIPAAPSPDQIRAAVEALLEVVADFPFETPAHRSAWTAALLTPLARFAFPGPSPLFLVDGNVRGVGKGLLLHALARIITGESFTIATYTHDPDELRKRITALALEGDRLVLFDNLDGKFGNAALDAALTGTAWKDRLLGHNRQVRVPLWACWYATGNNVSIAADTARRVCHIRLETPAERPEERADFRHPDLLGWVGKNRQRLLAAALTVLRGYVAAGWPAVDLPAWGSFDGWSRLVRSAVVWAGLADPGETRRQLQDRADVAAGGMAALLAGWDRIDPSGGGLTAAQVIDRVCGREPYPDTDGLREAIDGLVVRPDPKLLGYRFRHYRRRVFGGRFLDLAGGSGGTNRWAVFPADRFRRPSADPTDPQPTPSGVATGSAHAAARSPQPTADRYEEF